MAKGNNMEKLNIFLSNLAVMNIRVHNLHWNVVGSHFKIIHEITGKMYETLQKQFDEVAELMRMLDMRPVASLTDYLDNTTFDELESRDYNGYEALEELSAGCEEMISLAKEIRDEANGADHFMVANLFENYIACYTKKSWMLHSMMMSDATTTEDE